MPGRWSVADAVVFIAVFTAMRIAFVWLATQAILALAPTGRCCDTCGGDTLPLRLEGVWRLFAWRPLARRFHRRFCASCGWSGLVQHAVHDRRHRDPSHATAKSTLASRRA